MTDRIASFAASVGVMKPAKVKDTDTKALKRLDALLDSPEYVAEEKIDGCHYKMIGNRFFSVDNVEKTNNFPHLVKFFEGLKMLNIVLDGEIHYPGKTSQYATHVTGASPATAIEFQEKNGYIHFTIFELLRTPKANWTVNNTYAERRRLLEYFYNTFIKGKPEERYIHLVEARREGKREYVQGLLDAGLEGAVLKQLTSIYYMGKKPMWKWMKIKQGDETDLIVMGFEPPKKVYTGDKLSTWEYWEQDPVTGEQIPVTEYHYKGWIGSVVFGAYVNGVLTKLCTASGMSKAVRQDMSENPEKYVNKVAKVTFMEKTEDGYPRHPILKSMHEGKIATECTWEFD